MAGYRDCRAILLLKADYEHGSDFIARQDRVRERNRGNGYSANVCLGEYDGLITYALNVAQGFAGTLGDDASGLPGQADAESEGPLLRMVERENVHLASEVRHAQFFSSLYIVRDCASKKSIQDFWGAQRRFFCVTSVYMPEGCVADFDRAKKSRMRMEEALGEAKQDGLQFDHRIYSTLQIAELAIVWKSDSLRDVMEAMRRLYLHFDGYTRTICAVPVAHLFCAGEERASLWPPKPETKLAGGKDAGMLSVHISTKSYQALQWLRWNERSPFAGLLDMREYETMQDFFTHGHEDYIGLALEADDFMLYRLLHDLVMAFPNPEFRAATAHLQTQFAIRILEPGQLNQPEDRADSGLAAITKWMVGRVQKLAEHPLVQQQPWFYEFAMQGQLLRQMACSFVMDSVVFLLLDSVNYFCEWLEALFDPANRNDEQAVRAAFLQKNEIFEYLRGWSHLSTHMIRSDAIMQVHPSMPPPSDNFCTGVLEFCYAFLYRTTKYLRDLESFPVGESPRRTFVHVLVPTLRRWVMTTEYFKDDGSFDIDKGPSFLYLEVPYQNISEPFFMISSLVHEGAHYFGERLRKLRGRIFAKCVAMHLCVNLKLRMEPEVFAYLSATLQELLVVRFQSMDDLDYLVKLRYAAEEALTRILSQEETYRQLQAYSEYQRPGDFKDRVNRLLYADYPMRLHGPSRLHNAVDQMIHLCKEGYADIVMIDTLGLTPLQYLRMFALSSMVNSPAESDDEKLRLYQRVSLVLEAMNRAGQWAPGELGGQLDLFEEEIGKGGLPEEMRAMWRACAAFIRRCRGGLVDVMEPGMLSGAELELLVGYLTQCKAALDNAPAKFQQARDNFRGEFKTIVMQDQLHSDRFRRAIYFSRKKMLERLEHKRLRS